MKKAKPAKKTRAPGGGAKVKGPEKKERHNVTLMPSTVEVIKAAAGGNLSGGIEKLAEPLK